MDFSSLSLWGGEEDVSLNLSQDKADPRESTVETGSGCKKKMLHLIHPQQKKGWVAPGLFGHLFPSPQPLGQGQPRVLSYSTTKDDDLCS